MTTIAVVLIVASVEMSPELSTPLRFFIVENAF
jgi:hypothetical protein